MKNVQFTKNFSLVEMLESQTAVRKNISEQFEPSEAVIEELRKLCVNVLQPIRDKIGVPVRVSSGYRCSRLNKAIGGSRVSQHTRGQAADISADGFTTQQLFDTIIEMKLPFDQIIQEFDRWVHISFNSKGNRFMKLSAKKNGGKTQYVSIEN